MRISPERFKTIHACAIGAALLAYVPGIFWIKALQPAIIIVFGVGFFNLFHLRYFAGRLRLAAHVWLIPTVMACVTYGLLIEKEPSGQNSLWFAIAFTISFLPFLLLITGTTGETAARGKKRRIVTTRIIVQTLLFMLYATVTAVAWIQESRPDLFYWGMFHVLATALLPFIVGRVLCSWICPNATVQDSLCKNLSCRAPLERLPRSIDEQSRTAAMSLAGAADRGAAYIPFTLLLLWFVLFNIETIFDTTGVLAYSTFFMFGVIILSFLFSWRKLCTHFCWIAGYKTLVGQASLLRLRYNREACRQCSVCHAEAACPFFIDIRNQVPEMPATCCLCFECVEACPFKDVLTLGAAQKTPGPHPSFSPCNSE